MTSPSTDIVPPGVYDTGLDDLTSADLVVPRIRIKHKLSVFEDSTTSEQFPELFCIILGLVRQRVLFHHNVEDGDVPICKSPDFQLGFTNASPEKTKFLFPFDAAKLNAADFPVDENGMRKIPCQSCHLKEWGSHPTTGDKPYCAEQFTLPIYYSSSMEELKAGSYAAALISFQKTAVPPTKKYLGYYKQRSLAAYTNYTTISLMSRSRGQNEYCVPVFVRGDETETADHLDFSENYATIREFLTQTAPINQTIPEQTVSSAAEAAGAGVVGSNVPTVVTAQVVEDDELPF